MITLHDLETMGARDLVEEAPMPGPGNVYSARSARRALYYVERFAKAAVQQVGGIEAARERRRAVVARAVEATDIERLRAAVVAAVELCEVAAPSCFPRLREALGPLNPPWMFGRSST